MSYTIMIGAYQCCRDHISLCQNIITDKFFFFFYLFTQVPGFCKKSLTLLAFIFAKIPFVFLRHVAELARLFLPLPDLFHGTMRSHLMIECEGGQSFRNPRRITNTYHFHP